jgi:hypothetical protein
MQVPEDDNTSLLALQITSPEAEGPEAEGPDAERPDTEGPDDEGLNDEEPNNEGLYTILPDDEGPICSTTFCFILFFCTTLNLYILYIIYMIFIFLYIL